MKNFLKNYYSWNSSLWLQNKVLVLHKQKTHEIKWKKLLTRLFTYKCLKMQLKPLLVSKEWTLFVIICKMHTSLWEFKQTHQRGNSGFQTARITLHWCELYESHLSNAKFPEPVSFLCFFINYHLPFVFPCYAREKALYWSHNCFAFASYTKGFFTVSSDFSAASFLPVESSTCHLQCIEVFWFMVVKATNAPSVSLKTEHSLKGAVACWTKHSWKTVRFPWNLIIFDF